MATPYDDPYGLNQDAFRNVTQPVGDPVRETAAPTSPSLAGNWGYDVVSNAYRDYLGRPGSEQEILSHLGNGRFLGPEHRTNVMSAVDSIRTSPEATARTQAASAPAPTQPSNASGGGGAWNQNYEWEAAEGGPRVGDLFGRIGDPSRMTGFNTAGWGTGERGTESLKNTFGMIASRYDPRNDASLGQILADPDFRAFFPNAVQEGVDKIDFDGPGGDPAVDVWRNHVPGQGGDAWAYQPPGGAGGSSGGGAVMSGGSDLFNSVMGAGSTDDTLARIQQELNALINGQPSDLAQEAFRGAMV
jgi:hypothetical protein